ncbi:MAG TPA: hypothetical protein PKW52_11885 [Nitrospira sp.]|nr:hypothetical protein [Nitrospira sp.]
MTCRGGILFGKAALEIRQHEARTSRPIARGIIDCKPLSILLGALTKPLTRFSLAQSVQIDTALGHEMGRSTHDTRSDISSETRRQTLHREQGPPVRGNHDPGFFVAPDNVLNQRERPEIFDLSPRVCHTIEIQEDVNRANHNRPPSQSVLKSILLRCIKKPNSQRSNIGRNALKFRQSKPN